jgi:hypothetical protein
MLYQQTLKKKTKTKERRKVVISIENHVMAIHIKNYFLLIQPPASWRVRTKHERENNKEF